MTAAETPRSTGEMMSDIIGNAGNLVRNEVDLARAEVAGSMSKAAGTIASMAVALVLAITGLNVLAGLLVALVVEAGLSPTWAALAVGAGLLLIALAIFRSAKAALHHIDFVPSRAARNVQRDAAAIKDSFNDK